MSSPVRISVDTVPSEPIKIDLSGPSTRQAVEVSAPIVYGRAQPYEGPYVVEPTEQAQTLETNGLGMTDDVTVEAIPSDFVGRDIPRHSSEDLTASGATVSVPAGYYESDSSKAVDNAVWRGGSRIETDPAISVDENGLITASYDLSTPVSPITGSGYASRNQTYSVRVLGESTRQLPVKSSADLTAVDSTVTAPAGYYPEAATKDIASGVRGNRVNRASYSGTKKLYTIEYPDATSGYYSGSMVANPGSIEFERQQETVTPTESSQEITPTNGYYYLEKVTVDPIPSKYHDMSGALAYLGVDAELVTTLPLADVKLSATNFNGWTPSTTATDILASRTAGTFVATDSPNWNYFIVWETMIPEVVYTGSPVDKARPLYFVAVHVNEIYRRPSSYANIQSAALNNSVNMSAFTASNFLRYYGSTQGSVTYTWSASYGFYAGITAATLSSASADSPTITAKSPKVTARCSTTYFSTGNAALVDQDKTIIKQTAYVYKARIPTLMQGLWNRVIALVNEVDS